MAKPHRVSRRGFLGHAASVGAASVAAPYFVSSNALAADAKPGANDKINLGLIGVGLKGTDLLKTWLKQPDVVVTAVCDVSQKAREAALALCKGTAKESTDYREVLARKDVDAVVIATPPHWHALQAIDACEAGKDFYLEKPMTMHLGETIAVYRAVQRHKPITQIGTQIHATDNYRRVVEYVRSGKLGHISTVRAYFFMNQGPGGIGQAPDGDPPEWLDWNMWCGPAPARAFNPLLIKGGHEHASFMDYSGGFTPGLAPHIIDLPIWALELGCPSSVSATGGRYVVKDSGDAYDNHEVLWQYPKMTMTWMGSLVNGYGWAEQTDAFKRRHGSYFHGVNGTLHATYRSRQVTPEGDFLKDASEPPPSIPESKGHEREWLDALRSRTQPLCHVGYHYRVDMACTLSVLAMKLGRTLRFDPRALKIVGDAEAERLAIPTYRDPWKFPTKYL